MMEVKYENIRIKKKYLGNELFKIYNRLLENGAEMPLFERMSEYLEIRTELGIYAKFLLLDSLIKDLKNNNEKILYVKRMIPEVEEYKTDFMHGMELVMKVKSEKDVDKIINSYSRQHYNSLIYNLEDLTSRLKGNDLAILYLYEIDDKIKYIEDTLREKRKRRPYLKKEVKEINKVFVEKS